LTDHSRYKRILVLYAHAAPHRSRVNRRLAAAARQLEHVDLHDLYETYPDFHIDVEEEQRRLQAAELVVFQHPIQWYSMPALMKEWVDLVLEAGWAYGEGGNALRGKTFWLVATTGGVEQQYQPGAYHGYVFDAFLPPFEMTARLCGMRWAPPLILHGSHQVANDTVREFVDHYTARLNDFPHGDSWKDGNGA